MRNLLLAILVSLLLAACAPAQPAFTDNGKPGRIQVTVFLDTNGNGAHDSGEPGVADRVAISQMLSCPPTDKNKMTIVDTDAQGVAVFQNLKPGKYCVSYNGDGQNNSKLTYELPVSSDQTVQVTFALLSK